MQHPGWVLLILGLTLAAAGLVWLLAPPIPWLGRLPGDIVIERESFGSTSRFWPASCSASS